MFLPKRLRVAMTGRQQEKHAALLDEVKALRVERNVVNSASGSKDDALSPPKLAGIDVRIGLLNERIRKYPADVRQLGPTALANALRAIETYGWDRYRLDSQTLWSEIQSVIPERLIDEHERSRAPVNFFVSLVYLSLSSGITLIATGLYTAGGSMTMVTVGVALVATAPLWYRLAILNTRYLLATMQAAVNVSRVKLAESMGLVLPRALADERDMWARVYYFVHDPFDADYDQDLNSYRAGPESAEAPVSHENQA
ncbi:hypothetical protein [Ornithinimicrobium murale]|uniref:hypothetical protein n=1 Tax=Ornithinimicrobium murale TaxID=1050153 RepID=UPI0013B41B04|nr:hypothetical protein [Ornithinimicrobium murale]